MTTQTAEQLADAIELNVFVPKERIEAAAMLRSQAAEIKQAKLNLAESDKCIAAMDAEIERLRDALDEISDHAPWGGSKDKHIAWMQNIARAALGEGK